MAGDSAIDFTAFGQADLRLSSASGVRSGVDGGFGKLRFGGEAADGRSARVTLTEISAGFHAQIGNSVTAQVTAQYSSTQTEANTGSQFDIVDAFVRWRPLSLSRNRFSLTAGAVFPHVSFENSGRAWGNINTLTNSAANTWIAEEFRPVGIETTLEHRADTYNLFLSAGIFFVNDRSGVALAFRGFTLNAQKTGLRGKVPVADIGERIGLLNKPFVEDDNRPGFSLGLRWKRRGFGEFSLYAADNRADARFEGSNGPLWRTRFVNLAASHKFGANWRANLQATYGDTVTSPSRNNEVGTRFSAFSLTLAHDIGALRLALRPEIFHQTDISTVPFFDLGEAGYAVTAAARYRLKTRAEITAEWVHTNSDRQRDAAAPASERIEDLLQINFRIKF